MKADDRLLTMAEARYLAISEKTVRAYVGAGKLVASSIARRLRFKPEDVEAFVQAQQRPVACVVSIQRQPLPQGIEKLMPAVRVFA